MINNSIIIVIRMTIYKALYIIRSQSAVQVVKCSLVILFKIINDNEITLVIVFKNQITEIILPLK